MIIVLADVWVPGLPKTKGSLDVVTTKYVREAPGVALWRALIAERVRSWRADRQADMIELEGGPVSPWAEPWPGPVSLAAVFHLPGDPIAPRAGDLDKLLRCALDAIGTESKHSRYNGGAIVNDNQVVQIMAQKHQVGEYGAERPGLELKVCTQSVGRELA